MLSGERVGSMQAAKFIHLSGLVLVVKHASYSIW